MDWRDHIHSDPEILGGKPVIRGTRITVELILEYLADGASLNDVLEAYPHLDEKSVRAAIAFAHDIIVDGHRLRNSVPPELACSGRRECALARCKRAA